MGTRTLRETDEPCAAVDDASRSQSANAEATGTCAVPRSSPVPRASTRSCSTPCPISPCQVNHQYHERSLSFLCHNAPCRRGIAQLPRQSSSRGGLPCSRQLDALQRRRRSKQPSCPQAQEPPGAQCEDEVHHFEPRWKAAGCRMALRPTSRPVPRSRQRTGRGTLRARRGAERAAPVRLLACLAI